MCKNLDIGGKKDEFDNNYRNLLNFGHTAGHAIEKISGLKGLNHGQAVAIGMIIAIDISISLGLLKDSFRQEIISLYTKLKLPYGLDIGENPSSEKLADDVFNAMKFDKKFSASTNKFVLLKGINSPVFYHNVEEKVIKEAILKNIEVKL